MDVGFVLYYVIGIAATFVPSMFAYNIALRRGWSVPRWLLVVAISCVPVFLLVAQLLKFTSLHMYVDVAHWLQLLQGIVETGIPYVESHAFIIPGTRNYFSVHFVPLTYLVAIPFALLPYPQTIFVLNIFVMSSAAIPLYLLARYRTGDRRFALLLAVLLLWYPTFQYLTLYEFEMLRFSIPILLWMLYAWERQRIGWYYICVVLAVLVREEVGLTVAMVGVLLVLRRAWLHGIITTLFGLSAFTIITGLLMPLFRDGTYEHIALGAYDAFGRTPFAVAIGVLTHPIRMLTVAFHPVKLANLAMLVIPLLGLPLLAPVALLPTLPTVAVGLLSASFAHSSYLLYYVAPAIPFLFLAVIEAWPRVTAWAAHRIHPQNHGAVVRAATTALLIGALIVGVVFGPSPIALQFWSRAIRPAPFRTQSFHWSTYRVTDHHRAAAEVVAAIPDGAIVSAPQAFFPRLARTRAIMVLPKLVTTDGSVHAGYAVVDETNNGLPPESPAFIDASERAVVTDSPSIWRAVITRDGITLYRRMADRSVGDMGAEEP
ncbi:DUF2079 domain-containing protein [Candidatus Uhrbacteria bacterium]|nr:DUF2079 domain-containing protein [Candidatus Uhrbacteria bacterium]